MILAATRIEKSKNEDRTLSTKTRELSDEIHFDFRFRSFQLPVREKQPTSGLRSETEVEKLTVQKLWVNCIHPQSFMKIHERVIEGVNMGHLKYNGSKANLMAKSTSFNEIHIYNQTS